MLRCPLAVEVAMALPLLLLPLLSACAPDAPSGGADSGGGDGGGAVGPGTVPPDCVEDAAAFSELSTLPTLAGPPLAARWQTTRKGQESAWWSDGQRGGLARAGLTGGTALLIGPGPLTTVHWLALVDTGDQLLCSPMQEATAGAAPVGIPELSQTVTGTVGEALVLVPILGVDTAHVSVIDPLGRVIWARQGDRYAYRAALARDGEGIWTASQAWSATDPSVLQRLGLDGGLAEERTVVGGHTDMVELPDGALATLGWDIRVLEGRKLLGDSIVELGLDGFERRVWTIWDDYQPDLSNSYSTDFYVSDPTVEDWSHGNGLHYAEHDDAYLVTMGNLDLVIKVDRATGQMLWSVGRLSPTVQTPQGLIDSPHSVQQLEDGSYLVFNRHRDACSSVVHFTVDEEAGEAVLQSRYESPDCLEVIYLGDARRVDDGQTYISWSSAGRLEELDPDGRSARQVEASLGAVFGFIDVMAELGAP
jgi:hypothetical protein